ncbi:MAG: Uma2 family endonuclease [Desulfotomaculales bacterium]
MKLTLVDERNRPYRDPYLVRLYGWTLQRYLAEGPEHPFCEFVREEVVMYSPATAEHQRLVGFLFGLLQGYCQARRWGEVLTGPAAITILPDVVREPDLFVLPPEEVPKAKGVPLEVRPALVIEVVSPATRTVDLKEKPEDYAQAGIREYWAVDPDEGRVVVHRLLSGPEQAGGWTPGAAPATVPDPQREPGPVRGLPCAAPSARPAPDEGVPSGTEGPGSVWRENLAPREQALAATGTGPAPVREVPAPATGTGFGLGPPGGAAPAYAVEALSSGRLEAATVPGFWLQVEWLWQEPLPPVARCLEAVLGAGESP